MLESFYQFFQNFYADLAKDLAAADSELASILVLIVSIAIVLDAVSMALREKQSEAGVSKGQKPVSIDGSEDLPARNYVSERLGLAGKPDAVFIENGLTIPVEVKPLANKIRDRYIAQLLVYMRLIEEIEGQRPPYGYLILGQSRRRVRIDNTAERQAWLQKMIDEMQAVLAGVALTKASPHPKKCKNCNVRENCEYRLDLVELKRRA